MNHSQLAKASRQNAYGPEKEEVLSHRDTPKYMGPSYYTIEALYTIMSILMIP